MKALIVYETWFGNTEEVARAVAAGLEQHLEVEIVEVSAAPREITELFDLIVVGGPTHAFSLSRPSTRVDAVRQGAAHTDTTVGLREWLEALHAGPHSELVATFDTRVAKVRHLPGSAARRAAHLTKHSGYDAAAKPTSFYVADVAGPLLDGELARAEAWGDRLGREAQARAHGRLTP
jgi:hypothetical protein